MHTTIPTMNTQRGAATLIVALILLLAITLMTFSGVRVGVTEQRISANDLRAKQAMSVAEALIENGVAYLEANKQFINEFTLAAGWLSTVTGPARWQSCTTAMTAVPCGDGTTNRYSTTDNWLFYTPSTARIPSVSNGVYAAAYTESVSFVTRNLGTVAAPIIAAFPIINVIADVKPSADDPLAGSAQAKQIVKAFPLTANSPENAVIALGSVGLSGSYTIWGNPTGLRTKVLSTTPVPAGGTPLADYIIAYNNRPAEILANSGWTGTVVGNLSDHVDTTFFNTTTNNSTINFRVNNTAAYANPINPIASITIGVRAKIAAAGAAQLDWGPVIAGTPYFDTVTGTPSTPVVLTDTWTDYYKTWNFIPPANNVAWTVTDITNLAAQFKATTGGADVQIAEVWVDGYRVRYTVDTLAGSQTVVETGFPLTVRSRNAAAGGTGNFNTCRNWSSPTLPPDETAPYPTGTPPRAQWYPGGNSPSCDTLSSRSVGIRSDMISNDTSVPADPFQYIFGEPKTNYLELKSRAVILADCSSLSDQSTGLFWITGNCNPGTNATYGSPTKPIIIIVQGDIYMNGNPYIYGLLYAFSVPGTSGGTVKFTGNVVIVGAFVSDHAVDLGNGSFTLVFNRSVLSKIEFPAVTFAKVPGGWTDQLTSPL